MFSAPLRANRLIHIKTVTSLQFKLKFEMVRNPQLIHHKNSHSGQQKLLLAVETGRLFERHCGFTQKHCASVKYAQNTANAITTPFIALLSD